MSKYHQQQLLSWELPAQQRLSSAANTCSTDEQGASGGLMDINGWVHTISF